MPAMLVHQALHGYESGHTLIASSIPLTGEVHIRMLQRSDLTGSFLAEGFTEYLTGYPVHELGVYALARTWQAREVERPGAVWTHTLLISFGDLATIDDLSVLINGFQRPTSATDEVAYRKPLELLSRRREEAISMPHVELLLRKLYADPTKTAFVQTNAERPFERATLAVWSQMWPRLRRSFSFCTGVMASGSPALADFDLQIGPPGFVFQPETPEDRSPLAWIQLALEDVAKGGSPFREFIHQFGAEAEQGRMAFRPLAEVYRAMRSPPQFVALVEAIEDLAPMPAQMVRLKKQALSPQQMPEQEAALLAALVRSPEMVDIASVNASGRARSLAESHPQAAIELVRASIEHPNPLAESLVREVAAGLQGRQFSLEPDEFAVALALLGMRPALAAEEWAYSHDPSRQRQVLEVLRHAGELRPNLAKTIASRMMAADTPLARIAFETLGEPAVQEALDRLNAETPLPRTWEDALVHRSGDVREWLTSQPKFAPAVARIVARTLSPRDPVVQETQQAWLYLAGRADLDDAAVAFLFIAAEGMDPSVGVELTRATFNKVYRLAWDRALGSAAYEILESHVPHLLIRNWDMCERIARSVGDRFSERDWPPSALLDVCTHPDLLDRVLNYLDNSRAGRRVRERLKDEIPTRKILAQPVRDVLKKQDLLPRRRD